jgi:hypothetical protein
LTLWFFDWLASFGSALAKFVFSKKATKIDEIFTVNLTLCSKCQIDGEDFFQFLRLLRKHELYYILTNLKQFACQKSMKTMQVSNSGHNKKVYLVNQFINHLPWASNTVSHLMPEKGLTATPV